MYTAILKVFVVLILVVIAFFKWKFTYWKRRNVQNPLPKIPFGNIFPIMRRQVTVGVYLKNLYQLYKHQGLRYFGCYFLAKPILVIIDPDLVKTIFTKDFQHFTDHWNYANDAVDPLSGNLFGLKGSKWKIHRAELTPAFTSGKMKMMFETMMDCSKDLVEIMDRTVENNERIDVEDVFGRFITDIIGCCIFGIECNSLKNPSSEFRKYGKAVFDTNMWQGFRRALAYNFSTLLKSFKLRLIRKDISDFFMNVVEDTVRYREENGVVRKDFMHLLIQLKNNVNIRDDDENGLKNANNIKLNMAELAAHAFVFFLAGFETSSSTLTFCFYELATNTDIQEKLRTEIKTILKKHNGTITYDALADMTYMDMCIRETLRKYPPFPFLVRACTKDYKIPDSTLVVNKGMQLSVPILGIQHDPEYYPDPEKFDPDRFSSENKSKLHNFTWLSFGEGPRSCIGVRFGLMQIKVVLTILLKDYEFKLNSQTRIPLFMIPESIVLRAKGGIWLNAERVSTN